MTEKDFKIEKIQDGSFRVTRTDIAGITTHICYQKD